MFLQPAFLCCEEKYGCTHFTVSHSYLTGIYITAIHATIPTDSMNVLRRLSPVQCLTASKAVKPVVTHIFLSATSAAGGKV